MPNYALCTYAVVTTFAQRVRYGSHRLYPCHISLSSQAIPPRCVKAIQKKLKKQGLHTLSSSLTLISAFPPMALFQNPIFHTYLDIAKLIDQQTDIPWLKG